MLDVVGVVEQHGWPGAQAQGHNVPILSRPFAVIAKGITSEIEQVPEIRQPPGSGRPPAKLGTAFRMGLGRVFLPDRHVMNLNFGWKDCPFAALRTSPLVWQAAWLTICFRVYGTSASSQGALVSRQGARERGLEAGGGRGVGHAHAGLLFKFATPPRPHRVRR